MKLAVTGHRPDKLSGYGEAAEIELIDFAARHIKRLDPELVYIGMALGWDQACAWACRRLQIPFVACVPFKGQEALWRDRQRVRYNMLIKIAKEVVYVSEPPYSPDKMHKRNVYMVTMCDQVLALWNGTLGGTSECVDWAHHVNKPVENVWKEYAETPTYRHFQENRPQWTDPDAPF